MSTVTLEIPEVQWKTAKAAMKGLLSELNNFSKKSVRDNIRSIDENIFAANSISNKISKITSDELDDMMDEIQDEVKQSDNNRFTVSVE